MAGFSFPAFAWCFCVAACIGAAGAAAQAASPEARAVVWVHEQEPRAVVVTPDEPEPIARYAAEELTWHVKLATGADLPIVTESDPRDPALPAIYVGSTQAALRNGIDHRQLAPEHVVLRHVGEDLFIAGRDGPGFPLDTDHMYSGTLWGVYEVLERTLNARWLWPGDHGVVVDSSASLEVPRFDERVEPRLLFRTLRTYVPWKADGTPVIYSFTKRGQDSGLAYSSQEALHRYLRDQQVFLRRHRQGTSLPRSISAGHSFTRWWAEYGESHPEWFQLTPVAEGEFAGKPVQERVRMAYGRPQGSLKTRRGPDKPDSPATVSMCVSNREFHREIIARWQREREKDPNRNIHVGENDIWALCICDECVKLDGPQKSAEEIAALPGSVPGLHRPFDAGRRYAWFYREVHRLAAEIDPNVLVAGYVYLNYFVAPEDIELHPNIVLTFVPWGGFYYPRDPREQVWLEDQWKRWQKTGARLLYRPNHVFGGGSMPHNYAHQMIDQFDFFLRHGCLAAHFDGRPGQWSVRGSTMYALLRKHNDPTLSAGQLLQEYYTAFGPAAFHIKAYFDYWEAHTTVGRAIDPGVMQRNRSNHLLTYARAVHALYSEQDLDTAQAILDQAKKALTGKEAGRLGAEDVGDYAFEGQATASSSDRGAFMRRVEYIEHGLTHARKVRRLSAVFADTDSTRDQQQEALRDLVRFRRETEHLHVANYAASAFDELSSFSNRYDFNVKLEMDERPADTPMAE